MCTGGAWRPFLHESTFQRRFQLPDRRIARSAYRIQRKACAGLAAIAFDLEPAEAAIEALTNCRRWLGRPAVTLHTDRPCFGLGAIRFADGFNCFFPRLPRRGFWRRGCGYRK